jgi:AcrR family transcriptional regulator
MGSSYHHGDLRNALVAAALKLLETRRPQDLSMREIARRAKVSSGAPFHHFPDKEALLAAVAEQGFLALAAAVRAADARAGRDPLVRLRAIGRAYVKFATTHRAEFAVMFGGWTPPREAKALNAAKEAAGEPLRAVVADAKRELGFVAHERDAVLAAWALAHGVAMLWNEGPLPRIAGAAPEALMDRVTVLFEGALRS